jgi:hypothetical protein
MSWKGKMTTTPRGDLGPAEASHSSALGDGAVITAPGELTAHQADTYRPAQARERRRTAVGAPGRPHTATYRRGSRNGGIVLYLRALHQGRGMNDHHAAPGPHDVMSRGKLGL